MNVDELDALPPTIYSIRALAVVKTFVWFSGCIISLLVC